MSMNINTNELVRFIQNKMVDDKLDKYEAAELEIDDADFLAADADESTDLDIDEILDNQNLYEQFATMYVQELEQSEAKDNEEEAEETDKRRTSGKSESKA